VVLVDDHQSVLMAFRRLLQSSCEIVDCVGNGNDAINAVKALKPDILVVDLMMPDLDGLEVCRRVKQVAPETHVVIVTAFDDEHVHGIALQVGAAAFVPKHSGDALEDAIQRIFNQETEHFESTSD
jgi:DNA-binding NarL/FixJ family response regulator